MSSDAILKEQRGSTRVAKPIDVQYTYEGERYSARLEDLSETGAYLDTQHRIDEREELTLIIELPTASGDRKTLHLPAGVAWSQKGFGMGICFRDLAPEDREALRYFIGAVFFGHA